MTMPAAHCWQLMSAIAAGGVSPSAAEGHRLAPEPPFTPHCISSFFPCLFFVLLYITLPFHSFLLSVTWAATDHPDAGALMQPAPGLDHPRYEPAEDLVTLQPYTTGNYQCLLLAKQPLQSSKPQPPGTTASTPPDQTLPSPTWKDCKP